jgi:hypothetical protein
MKIKAIIACCFLILLVSFQHTAKVENIERIFEPPLPNAKMQARGEEEDPNARLEYEWLRTRDPKTNQVPENIRQKELVFSRSIPTRSQLSPNQNMGGFQGSFKWNKRGPYNVGGRTRAMAIDISDATDNTVLAGGVSGGMWRTVDGGATWTKATKSEQFHSVTTLAQDLRTGHTSTWYYGTGELRGNSAGAGGAPFRGDGIYKSTNGGKSWSVLSSTSNDKPQIFDSNFNYVWTVQVAPANGYVFAAAYNVIKRSIDGGDTWIDILKPTTGYSSYTDVIVHGSAIYATMSYGNDKAGVWRSGDYGDTWTNITPSNFPSSYSRMVVGGAPSNDNIVYLIGDIGSGSHTLWKYTYDANGGTWVDRSANIPAFGGLAGDFDSQGSYDLILKVKPDDEDFVFVGGTNLYRSSDGFATSTNSKWIGGYSLANNYSMYENHHPDQHGLVFSPSNSKKSISSHDGGLSLTLDNTADEVSWTSMNNGYYTTQFYHVAIDPSQTKPDLVMGGLQDNGTWKSEVNKETTVWESIHSGDGAYNGVAFNANILTYSHQNGNVYLSDYRNPFDWSLGYSWIYMTPPTATGMLFINPYVINQSDEKILFFAGGSTIWRNNNINISDDVNTTYRWDPVGGTWESNQWEELTALTSTSTITALTTTKSSPENRLFYGDAAGQVYRRNGANTGTGAALNVTSSDFPSNAYVSSISSNSENGDEVIVTFSNYEVISVWYSKDGGLSWDNISGNLEENANGTGNGPSVKSSLIQTYKSITSYFVGTSTGLYMTNTLNGASTTWAQEGENSIGKVVVDAVAGRASDGYIAVATHGNGVYTSSMNQKPVVSTVASVDMNEDTTATISIVTSDPDNDPVTATVKSDTNALKVSLASNVITLIPDTNWFGNANIIITANDGITSDSVVVPVKVNNVQDLPTVFTWVLPNSTDTLNVSKSNTLNDYTFKWTQSEDVDGDTITYWVNISNNNIQWSSSLGKSTDTTLVISYAAFMGNWPSAFKMLSAATYNLDVYATDGIDTVSGGGGPRNVFIERYGYLDIADGTLPQSFALHPNYPNPFNPSTSITFDLPEQSNVNLNIYNALGQLVKSYSYNNYPAGSYKVRWNGKNVFGQQLSAGVYIYQLRAGKFVKSRKMILLK